METQTVERQNSWELRENLRRFSGRVLHVVRDKNLFRYRIDDSGIILHEKVEQAHRGLRKVVTGDPEKKIRDYMTEVPQVKLIDKLSFTFGVTIIVLAEFLVLRYPTYFTQLYYLLMSLLIANRYFQYKEEKQELFMLDFCYFMNVSVIIQTSLFPDSLVWFKANYVLCMGCLMLAIIVWQNSLVFHSLDKLTSFFLHAFPPMTLHLFRWQLIPSNSIQLEDSLSWGELLFWPMLLYSVWQLGFCFMTDVVFAEELRRDPDLVTSVRHLCKDKKNVMHILVKRVCRSIGVLAKDEEFDPDSFKNKVIFMITQFIYTLLTMILTPLLYTNYTFSFVYMVGIFVWCTWKGGSYYIEVFSERYKLKFIIKTDDYTVENKDNTEFEEAMQDSELYTQIYAALSQDAPDSGSIRGRNNSNSSDSNNSSNFESLIDEVSIKSTTSCKEVHLSRREVNIFHEEVRSTKTEVHSSKQEVTSPQKK